MDINVVEKSEAFLKKTLKDLLKSKTSTGEEAIPKVYLFGSRTKPQHSWNADFDVWIDAEVPSDTVQRIKETIEESFVPFHVDIVTASQLKGEFEQQVRAHAIRWL